VEGLTPVGEPAGEMRREGLVRLDQLVAQPAFAGLAIFDELRAELRSVFGGECHESVRREAPGAGETRRPVDDSELILVAHRVEDLRTEWIHTDVATRRERRLAFHAQLTLST